MLLLRPNPGACVDRQTILRLKMEEAAKTGVDATHFAEEHRALQLYLEQNWFPSAQSGWAAQFERYSGDLARVNQGLWDLENEIRHLKSLTADERKPQTDRIVSIAFSIPQLNDERARLVGLIDRLFGLTAPEKLYRASEPANAKN